MQKKFKCELVEQDWQYIFNALVKCPYQEVNALLAEMQRQFSLQVNLPAPVVPDEPVVTG